MDYTDFRISASSLGSILGLFGNNSRRNTLCTIWDKSTFKDSYAPFRPPKNFFWVAENEHLHLLGIYEIWKKLASTINLCSTQEDIERINLASFKLAFQNSYIQTAAETVQRAITENKLIPVDDATEICKLISEVITDNENYYRLLQELWAKKEELVLDGLSPFLDLLDMSSKLCYGIQKRSNCAYGIQGESKFIEAFNEIHEDTKIERVSRMYSKTVTGEELKGRITWCIDGRIDGLKDDIIMEIKHRRKKIMKRVPLYELLQLHAYMFLLGKQQAVLIQCTQHRGLVYSEQVVVKFVPHFWEIVVQQVKKSLNFILALHQQEILRQAFFLLDPKGQEIIMKQHMGNISQLSTSDYELMMGV